MTKRVVVGRTTKPCEKCGADVTRKHSAFKDHVFCSRTCYLGSEYFTVRRDASNERRFAGRREQRDCLHCGQAVDRPRSQFGGTQTYCSIACRRAYALKRATRQVNSHGYVKVFVGKDYPGAGRHGHVLEHRKVMEDHLGRPLTSDENVHHRNGDRADNRLENLELWTRSQPSGQRVEDKIAWARDFLALYETN